MPKSTRYHQDLKQVKIRPEQEISFCKGEIKIRFGFSVSLQGCQCEWEKINLSSCQIPTCLYAEIFSNSVPSEVFTTRVFGFWGDSLISGCVGVRGDGEGWSRRKQQKLRPNLRKKKPNLPQRTSAPWFNSQTLYIKADNMKT